MKKWEGQAISNNSKTNMVSKTNSSSRINTGNNSSSTMIHVRWWIRISRTIWISTMAIMEVSRIRWINRSKIKWETKIRCRIKINFNSSHRCSSSRNSVSPCSKSLLNPSTKCNKIKRCNSSNSSSWNKNAWRKRRSKNSWRSNSSRSRSSSSRRWHFSSSSRRCSSSRGWARCRRI